MHPFDCRCPICLVDRSSFGTPEAKAARESVSDEQVARVIARAKELDAEKGHIEMCGSAIVDGREVPGCWIETTPDPTPTVREAGDEGIAAVSKALRTSRLFYGTHSDRWLDQEWQQAFWTEAAEIALTTLEPLIAERERAAGERAWDEGRLSGIGSSLEAFHWGESNIPEARNPYRAALAPETPEAGGA